MAGNAENNSRRRCGDGLRIAYYVDSPELGGSEFIVRGLLGSLDPTVEVMLLGTCGEVVDALSTTRKTSQIILLPPVRGRSDLGAVWAHARVLRRFSPDVIHINQHHLWSGQYGMIASMLAGAPSIGVVHGIFPSSNQSQRLLTMAVAREVRCFVGVSEFVAGAIEAKLRIPRTRVRMIPNGIATDDAQPVGSANHDKGLITAIGRLAPEKGFDLILQALVSLSDVRLVLIGDGPERGLLERLARELGVASRVRFVGWSDQPWSVRPRPSLLVVPSRRDAAPLVILEAMREGVPVVASQVGGIPELVKDKETGLLVEPDDVRALAAAIGQLLNDPASLAAMGERARVRMQSEFTLEVMTKRYEQLYREVAHGPTPRMRLRSGRSIRADRNDTP
jgi:glycosyltransferase involved in cell wall biosynthesis